jgi:hypothetical protein
LHPLKTMQEMRRLTLTLSRVRTRACAWLALGLMAFGTLAPLVTGALVPAPAHGIEVCSSSGPRTVLADATGAQASGDMALDAWPAGQSSAPADSPPPGAGPGMHCALCLLSHGGLAPPPAAALFTLARAMPPALAWAPQAAPLYGAHQGAAAPRGPPLAA